MVTVKPKPKKKNKNITDEIIIKSEETGDILARYDEEMLQAITDTVAQKANRSELIMFLSVAKNYGLDPFRKEIWFTKIDGKPTVMTARDGYVKIAKQNPSFEKLQSSAVYENDDFNVSWENGELKSFTHNHGIKDRGDVIGAWASLKYHGLQPLFKFVLTEEYDKKKSVWKTNKAAMIVKVAEKEVCRLGEGVSGLYIEEEMPDEYSLKNTLEPKNNVEFKKKNEVKIPNKGVIDVKKIEGED